MALFVEILGLFGAFLIVLAYVLVTLQKVTGKDLSYHLINLVGALCILGSLTYYWNSATFAIELVWIVVSVYGIWKWWRLAR